MTDVSDAELLERFVTCRDEAAFAALMARHGPMVFGVCRRLLCHIQDTEDAFQATFLILVRKAASIGKRELLGNWLYGVAIRVASRARSMAAKRRMREPADMEQVAVAMRELWEATDLSASITEEVQRLPAKYRIPVVLCYLEGRSNDEAAGEMHCPIGTVKTRLSRAREMLRKRLIRRGLALSTAALSTALSAEALAAPLPSGLIDSACKSALDFAAGDAAALGLVSAQAAALTKGVLRTMFVTKMKMLAASVLALAVLGGVLTYYVLAAAADEEKEKKNIQGTWGLVSAETKGKAVPAEIIPKDYTVLITNDRIVIGERGGAYKIDPKKKPKSIDMWLEVAGAEEGILHRAIYELNGDDLKLCIQDGGGDRPKEFVTKPGTRLRLLVLKRLKK